MERQTSSHARLTGATAAKERVPPVHHAWLKRWSVAMHRRAAYPPGHPLRLAAQGQALEALERALEQESEIIIAVSPNQLAIDGASTEENNPALSELAERLHRRGVGTITLRAGVTAEEFEALLERVSHARHDDDDDDTLDDEPRAGAHVAVDMLSYDGLALADEPDDAEGPDGTGDRLWRELAETALAGWDGDDGAGTAGGGSSAENGAPGVRASGGFAAPGAGAGGSGDPRRSGAFGAGGDSDLPPEMGASRLARAISARARAGESGTTVLKSLLRVARHARRRGRAGGGAVAARLREVLQQLEPGTMASLLAAEVDPARKRVLVLQGVDALPVSAVLDWIEAAAKSADKSISYYLLRLLKKLSAQTRRRRDDGPDEGGESLRQAARQLIEGWTLEIRESEEHDTLLEHIAAYEGSDEPAAHDDGAGAERIVQIALETDVVGHDVIAAVDELIDAKRLGALLGLLDRVERSAVAAPALRAHVVAPETLRHILLSEPVELDAAQLLLERCDAAHAESMLDALTLSESQATRQLVLQRLRELGDVIRDQVVARLSGADWYVLRNLLALLGAMRALPPRLAVDSYMRHEEPAVRVEALRLLVRMPERRESAIHDALVDTDARVVRAALDAAATSGLPRRSGTRLLQVVEKADKGSELRSRGIALLGQAPTNAARDWLVKLVLRRRGFLRRLALQPASPELVVALHTLATTWRNDAAVAAAIKLAARSSDSLVRDAVDGGGRA